MWHSINICAIVSIEWNSNYTYAIISYRLEQRQPLHYGPHANGINLYLSYRLRSVLIASTSSMLHTHKWNNNDTGAIIYDQQTSTNIFPIVRKQADATYTCAIAYDRLEWHPRMCYWSQASGITTKHAHSSTIDYNSNHLRLIRLAPTSSLWAACKRYKPTPELSPTIDYNRINIFDIAHKQWNNNDTGAIVYDQQNIVRKQADEIYTCAIAYDRSEQHPRMGYCSQASGITTKHAQSSTIDYNNLNIFTIVYNQVAWQLHMRNRLRSIRIASTFSLLSTTKWNSIYTFAIVYIRIEQHQHLRYCPQASGIKPNPALSATFEQVSITNLAIASQQAEQQLRLN